MKQETLEDKLDKIVSKEQSKFWAESDERFKNKETLEDFIKSIYPSPNGAKIRGIELGAKWQQERMYSEEELKSYGEFCVSTFLGIESVTLSDVYLEQFKKK